MGRDGADYSNVATGGQVNVTHPMHASQHEQGGSDEINVEGLSGELVDEQPFAAHGLGGVKHTDATLAQLNALVSDATLDDEADPRTPKAHKTNHQEGGSDEVSLAGLGGATLTLTFIIDGGGAAITTGEKGHLEIPFACSIEKVTMLADQSGSIVVDIWKDTYANFPPTNADSITAAAVPTIDSAEKSQDSTLAGWTTNISADDVLAFNVDSCSTITRVTISLKVTKS